LKNQKDDLSLAVGYQCFAMVGDFNASLFENISFSPNKLKYKRGKCALLWQKWHLFVSSSRNENRKVDMQLKAQRGLCRSH